MLKESLPPTIGTNSSRIWMKAGAALALTGIGAVLGIPVRHQSDSLQAGLAMWRKPGAIQNGAACATCHSPDGIELAIYNFSDADILRRAEQHLSVDDANHIVEYIHGLRAKLGLRDLRDPMNDRPLQPGGEVLPGATPSERDYNFGLELEKVMPALFNGRIETIEQAKAAERQILDIDVQKLKIGIPFSRLSEDVAHGQAHASIDEWFPEEPNLIPTENAKEWYQAEDAYLADPTNSQLTKLLKLHSKLVNTNLMMGFPALSALKFRALLVWTNRVRNGTENKETDLAQDVLACGYNPIWEVGEGVRQNIGRSANQMGMTDDVASKKSIGEPLNAQMHSLRAGWFWAGWLSDQGLFRTSFDDKTRLGMWFSQSMSQDGPYAIHDVFANLRRQAVVSNNILSWTEPMGRRRLIWDFAGLRSFMEYQTDIPKTGSYRKLYLDLTTNAFREALLLLEDNIEKTGIVWVKHNTIANVDELARFIETQDPASAEDTKQLVSKLHRLTQSAKERY